MQNPRIFFSLIHALDTTHLWLYWLSTRFQSNQKDNLMNFKSILVLGTALAAVSLTSTARAEDVSLKLDLGAAKVLDTANADTLFTKSRFQAGMEGSAAAMFKLIPNLAIGPMISAMDVQQTANNDRSDQMW